jgi:hypothetical protein
MRTIVGVVGCVLLGLTVACGPGTTAPTASHQSSASAAQLSPDQALGVFRAFGPAFDSVRQNDAPAQAIELTTGIQTPAQIFQITTARSRPSLTVPPAGSVTGARVYVPRLRSFPRWFLATGTASSTSQAVLFVLVQASRGATWQAAISTPNYLGDMAGALSSIALDSAGYATVVAPDASGLVVSPASLAAVYARDLNGKPGATLFAAGPATSGITASDRQISAQTTTFGWRLTDVQRPARLPVYALRSKNGGAVVIFVTYDQFSWTALSAAAQLPKSNTQAAQLTYEPSPDVARAAGVTRVRAGLRISLNAFGQCIAEVPPSGAGLISVPLYSGGLVSITKS